MAAVYSAIDATTGQRVAIKIANYDSPTDPSVGARFQQETQLSSRLSHENFAKTLGHGAYGGLLYFAMELIDGPTLEEVIDNEAPLDPVRTATIGMQLAKGLAAIHGAKIVHRDLKPANVVLVEQDDGDQLVKILDFGISYALEYLEENDAKRFTAGGSRMGTPYYMAPEYLQAFIVQPSGDLYALG